MYRYTIGEGQWDCYCDTEILHDEKYSKKKFLDICKQAFSRLDYETRKKICHSFGDDGIHQIEDILIKEFGFIKPEKVTSHIHIVDLFDKTYQDSISCEDCSRSYELNGEMKCSYDECVLKEYFK